ARRGEQRAGTVVHLAHEAEQWRRGRLVFSKVVSGSIRVNHAARFLQRTVGIDQLAANRPCVWTFAQSAQQRRQPARAWQRVVIEENENVITRRFSATIA